MKKNSSAAYDRLSKQIDGPLTIISLLWIPVLVLPLIFHLSPTIRSDFQSIDIFVWALFFIEYITKLYLSPHKFSFIRSHIPDLIVIAIPFLRPLRLLRLMRLLRLTRIVGVLTEALRRTKSLLTHHGLHFVLLATTVILFVGAGVEYFLEHNAKGANIHSFGGALWWAIVTMTTVGYGDRYPVTSGGRGVAIVLMFIGIGLVGVVSATITSFFIEQEKDPSTDIKLERIEALLLDILKKQE